MGSILDPKDAGVSVQRQSLGIVDDRLHHYQHGEGKDG